MNAAQFSVAYHFSHDDIQYRWTTVAGKNYPQFLPPSWLSDYSPEAACNAPLFSLVGAGGRNRLTVAVFSALSPVLFRAGISGENLAADCEVVFTPPVRNILPRGRPAGQVKLREGLQSISIPPLGVMRIRCAP